MRWYADVGDADRRRALAAAGVLDSAGAGPGTGLAHCAPVAGSELSRARSSGAPTRDIGPRGLVVFYVTSVVGAGILVVPGIAARRAGPASLIAWLVLALASVPMALMFAEMSARRPDCGGIAALLRDVLGAGVGQTASLLLVVAYALVVPVMAIASARHLCDMLAINAVLVKPLAGAFLLLSAMFCIASIATAARLQGIVLILLLACLLVAVALATPSMSARRLSPFASHGWRAVAAILPAVFWSFLGWENVSTIAEEVRDPRRSFHRAIRIAVPLIGLLYLAVTAAYLALPHGRGELLMPTLLAGGIGARGRVLGDLFGLAVIVPTTNAWMLGASRLVVSAAREGLLPPSIQRRSTRTDAPVSALVALVVVCALVVSLLAVFDLDETAAISLSATIFLALYIAAAIATLRDHPTPIMAISATTTALIAASFLLLTGAALVLAALLALATYAGLRVARANKLIPPAGDWVTTRKPWRGE